MLHVWWHVDLHVCWGPNSLISSRICSALPQDRSCHASCIIHDHEMFTIIPVYFYYFYGENSSNDVTTPYLDITASLITIGFVRTDSDVPSLPITSLKMKK